MIGVQAFEIPLYKKNMSNYILNEEGGCTHLMTSATKFGDLVFPLMYFELWVLFSFPWKLPLSGPFIGLWDRAWKISHFTFMLMAHSVPYNTIQDWESSRKLRRNIVELASHKAGIRGPVEGAVGRDDEFQDPQRGTRLAAAENLQTPCHSFKLHLKCQLLSGDYLRLWNYANQ